jgi:hypothetical protein
MISLTMKRMTLARVEMLESTIQGNIQVVLFCRVKSMSLCVHEESSAA